jgi:calcium-dependent protein kinase
LNLIFLFLFLGEKRAIKSIKKDSIINKELFSSEMEILKEMDHPNIIKLFEVYESEKWIFLV